MNLDDIDILSERILNIDAKAIDELKFEKPHEVRKPSNFWAKPEKFVFRKPSDSDWELNYSYK